MIHLLLKRKPQPLTQVQKNLLRKASASLAPLVQPEKMGTQVCLFPLGTLLCVSNSYKNVSTERETQTCHVSYLLEKQPLGAAGGCLDAVVTGCACPANCSPKVSASCRSHRDQTLYYRNQIWAFISYVFNYKAAVKHPVTHLSHGHQNIPSTGAATRALPAGTLLPASVLRERPFFTR